jgi:uncharacterized membrane protein
LINYPTPTGFLIAAISLSTISGQKPMRIKSLDVILCNIVAIVAVVLTLAMINIPVIQLLVGIPLVVFIPGYVVIAALSVNARLEKEESLLYGVGMSLLITAIGGLLLNLTPFGLTASSWAVFLGLVILIADLVMVVRHPSQPVKQPHFPIKLSWSQSLMLLLAVIIIGVAFVISGQNISQNATRFTQLWLLPDSKTAGTVQCGISNDEGIPVQYKLQLQMLDGQLLHEWPTIALNAGEQWTGEYALTAGQNGPVQAVLYRLDKPDTVYRHVFLQKVS